MIKLIKAKFFNADGSVNGKVLAGAIAALLLIVQSVLALAGITLTDVVNAEIQHLIDAVLGFLAIIGVAENTQE